MKRTTFLLLAPLAALVGICVLVYALNVKAAEHNDYRVELVCFDKRFINMAIQSEAEVRGTGVNVLVAGIAIGVCANFPKVPIVFISAARIELWGDVEWLVEATLHAAPAVKIWFITTETPNGMEEAGA